ncbi:MAG: type II toxin-antitoxin system RelE/ParE family toxin [Nitrospira sp.]
MGKYSVEVKPAARKELEALSDPVLARVIRKLESLADVPRPAGCKKLKGYKDMWRIRIGDWRVVYFIDETVRLVSIMRIAHRREVYE